MTHRWQTMGRIAGLGLLALLLSACLKLDMDLQVSENNTVSGSIIFGVNKQLIELTGGSVEDFLGTDSPLPSDAEGVTTEPFEDDEFIGQRFVFDSVPLQTLSSGTPDELRITREGDTFTVTGALDLSSGLTGATGATGFPAEQFLQGADLQIRITFPGPVTDTNGEVDGNTVTWVPVVGERLELRATASAIPSGGDSNLTMLLIIAAAIVAAAVVVGIVVAQRRNRPAVAAPGSGASEGALPPVAGSPGPLPPPAAGDPGPPPPPTGPPPPPPPPGPAPGDQT